MASPFPGMDPYLEGEMWEEFQQTFIHTIRAQHMPKISPRYVGLLARYPGEVPQLRIEVRERAQRRLVTAIEVLSPANKIGDGGREYRERRAGLLRTQAHLLEIDLLRGGVRVVPHGLPPATPYCVYLSRAARRPTGQLWAIQLRDPLPVVPVPLLSPDPDISLDLQAAINACFDLVRYEFLLRYERPIPPPDLSPDDAAWVASRLEEFRT